jgi:hypothetical protein
VFGPTHGHHSGHPNHEVERLFPDTLAHNLLPFVVLDKVRSTGRRDHCRVLFG